MAEKIGISVHARSGPGVLHQLTGVMAKHGGDIASVDILESHPLSRIYFELELPVEPATLVEDLRALDIVSKVTVVKSLGKIYGNLMVDLKAWNEKLVDRSERIIMETTGVERARAREFIDAAEGSVKVAIVMARRGVSKGEAERLLAEHKGHLRVIVGDPPPVRSV